MESETTEHPSILVYMPNISTDKLMQLMEIQLGDLMPWVSMEKLPGKSQFRSPELRITLNDRTEKLQITVVQYLIEASSLLGASQFSFQKDGYSMRQLPTDTSPQHIEQALIAMNTFDVEQINIY